MSVSAPKIAAVARTWRFGPVLPFHTTNSHLVGLMKSQAGSERIGEVLATIPTDQSLAVVYRDANETDIFLAFVVAYFAWPRTVRSVPIRRENAASELQELRSSHMPIIFCGVDPPPGLPHLIRIGDRMVFAAATGPQ
ncbi:MAG: hypothetical protein M3Y80_10170 [Verrucomicrobiota bacterium]|nr:hypothetical protein [Verrucomicrobiota bacterium]